MPNPSVRILLLSLPLWLVACRDTKVAEYRIPKEADAPVAAAPAPAGMSGADSSGLVVARSDAGGLEWQAPAHWKSKPVSSMRKGSFSIGDEGGPVADFAITAFPGDVGGDLANVNRWRGQLSLPPISEAELAGALTPMKANGLKMLVTDLTGGTPDAPQRMLGAIIPYEGATWFFKLTGPVALVAQERANYLAFLETVKASAPAAAAVAPATPIPPVADMANTPVKKAQGPALKWTAPAHWQNKPASSMRKATYVVLGENDSAAELAVTAFPGDVGGELANVNRWRGQLNLPPIAEAELAGAVTRLTVGGLPVTVVELTGGTAGQPLMLLGAMVPFNGSTWFFKFTGPAAIVTKEKAAFLAFVQTINAP